MNDPTRDDYSVDNFEAIKRPNGQLRQSNDNGYVHANSGIIKLAFYLLSDEGGEHPRGVSEVSVSSRYNAYYGEQNINDAQDATLWVSRRIGYLNQEEWVMLDFGGTEPFDEVVIDWVGSDVARGYSAWTWDAAAGEWAFLGQGSQYGAGQGRITLTGSSAHYLLVVLRDGLPGRWMAVSELVVHH